MSKKLMAKYVTKPNFNFIKIKIPYKHNPKDWNYAFKSM